MAALLALVRKDLVLYFSNRRALLITVAAPIAIAAFFGSLFGGAGKTESSRLPIAIVDLDQSAVSKRIAAALAADPTFDVQPVDAAGAVDAVRRGKLRAVVTLPERFGAEAPAALVGGGRKPTIGIEYDPSQALALQVVQGLLARHVIEGVAADLPMPGGAPRPAGAAGPGFRMPYDVRPVEARASKSEASYNAYSHSFAGMGVQFILFMGIDLGIKLLTMRRLGLWQRLRAAPLSRGFLLGSQVASGTIIAILLYVLIFAAGIVAFGVRVEGSVVGFVGLIVAFATMTASFGLFIAALGRTPEATRGLAIFVTLVMVMLGGAWVPSFIFPPWLQVVSLAIPTRWAVDGFDAMTWRGLGLEAALLPVVVLLGFAAFFAVVAALRFDWDEK